LLVDIEPGMDLTVQIGWWIDLLRRALPLADGASARDRAGALANLAWEGSGFGRPQACEHLDEALQLLPDVKDPAVKCAVLAAAGRCHADDRGGQLEPDEIAAAIAAGDRAGGTYWPVMIRYFLSWMAPSTIADSLNTDALRLAERHGLDLFAALIRGNLASRSPPIEWQSEWQPRDATRAGSDGAACYTSSATGAGGRAGFVRRTQRR
jgi:hypothetical protein